MTIIDPKLAIEKLLNKEVVALPTETVYGLAARCDNHEALEKIFTTKQRPFFDPLILHVESLKQAQSYGQFDELSENLATHFWPGPLTLVLPKTDIVSNLINNGGETVALRSPRHPLFLEVLRGVGVPLAAPSANMFGKTSPTKAAHVATEFSGKVPIVDGGSCERGIESTVIEVRWVEKKLNILRPGIISAPQLQSFLKSQSLDFEIAYPLKSRAPGFLANHYQPSSPFLLIEPETDNFKIKDLKGLLEEPFSENSLEMTLPPDFVLAARSLYSELRKFSEQKSSFYFCLKPKHQNSEDWAGLRDRLKKACHFFGKEIKGHWEFSKKTEE